MGVRDQAENAADADCTALSRSDADDMGTDESSFPSIGEITGSDRDVDALTKLPLMKLRTGGYFIEMV